MLKPVLRNQMLPEHRFIYSLKIPLTDEGLKERIIGSVQHIRKTNRRNGVNKLEAKLAKYGNSGGWYRERVKQAVKKLYLEKHISKQSVGKWRSIEFELIFKSKDAAEEFGYAIRSAGVADRITIKNDDSIRLNDHDLMGIRHEVVLSYLAGHEDDVRAFCKCLKGRAYVNWSCGTHFHLDMRHMDQEKVTEYGNRLARAVPALRLLLPRDRRESKFCKTVINTTETKCIKCSKLSCDCHVQPHKYAFVNLAAYNKHKTIEVRGHSGTINAEKILNWIKLCEHIMLCPFIAPVNVTTIEDLIERYRLDKDLIAYIKERYVKFNDESSKWDYGHKFKTEGEEKPADQVDIPVHPAFLIPVLPAKNAQAAPNVPNVPGQFFVLNVNGG